MTPQTVLEHTTLENRNGPQSMVSSCQGATRCSPGAVRKKTLLRSCPPGNGYSQVRRRGTTLGSFTPYAITQKFSFKGVLKQSWDLVDYLRDPGTHMGHHREGGRTLTVQLNCSSCGPQGWAELNCLLTATALLGPTQSSLPPAPIPSSSADNVPHIHRWGTSTSIDLSEKPLSLF